MIDRLNIIKRLNELIDIAGEEWPVMALCSDSYFNDDHDIDDIKNDPYAKMQEFTSATEMYKYIRKYGTIVKINVLNNGLIRVLYGESASIFTLYILIAKTNKVRIEGHKPYCQYIARQL